MAPTRQETEPSSLRRDFSERDALIAYVRRTFIDAARIDDHVSPTRGGRRAAHDLLARIDPVRYAATRNELDGSVTRLSPYLRHGILPLAQVRDAALEQVKTPAHAGKLISELGWRDYFQRIYRTLGTAIWTDLEAYKTGRAGEDYVDSLPDDVREGRTGLACMDAFSRQLVETGYLHNHARMWLAAYLVHWRGVRWQAGARWFLTHLLDGDPASNNLSWQWVASTFSHKPYIFNRENLERFTDGVHCRACPLRGRCDFEGDYEALTQRLFPRRTPEAGDPVGPPTPARQALARVDDGALERSRPPLRGQGSPWPSDLRPLIWVHGDCLDPESPALRAFPGAPAIWVWDEPLLAARRVSLKRVLFLYESLLELPVTIARGPVVDTLLASVAAHGCNAIVTVESPSPRFAAFCHRLHGHLPLYRMAVAPFVTPRPPLDLRRFSRYWRQVQSDALTPKTNH